MAVVRQLLLGLALLLVADAAWAQPAQPLVSATLTNGTCTTEGVTSTGCVTLNTAGYGSAAIQVTSNAGGNTITFHASTDRINFVLLNCTAANSTTPQTSTTATGLFQCSAGGYAMVEAIITNYVSGTAGVVIAASASGGASGGGGGGGGSNAAAGATGAAVPGSASYTGFNSSGNLVGASAANPFPTTCISGCSTAGDTTSAAGNITANSGNGQTYPNGPAPYGLSLAGENGAAFTLAGGGSLSATITPQCSTDGGNTYPVNGYFVDPVAGTFTTTQTVSSPVSTTVFVVICPQGSSHASLKATPWNSGSGSFTGRGTVVRAVSGLTTGAVTTAAPTYTTGQMFPISLDIAGNLRTLANQGGTWTVNQGGTWTVQPGNTANTTPWLFTPYQSGANLFTGAVAITDTLVNPTTTGIAAYNVGWDATNSVWRRMQVTAGTGKMLVDGSSVTQPVTGAVTANAGTGNFNVIGTLTNNNAAPGANTNLGVLPALANTGSPTYADGNQALLSVDTSGRLRSVATQSGTWTVQPGNSANTTPWLFSINQGGNTAAVNASSQLLVNCSNCSGSGVSATDQTGMIFGTSNFSPTGGFYNTTTSPLAPGQQGMAAMTSLRSMFVSLADGYGRALSTFPITGTVSFSSAQPIQMFDRVGGFIDPRSIRGLTPSDTPLMFGNVTTAAPSYLSGTSQAISLDTSGNVRIVCVVGCAGSGGTSTTNNTAFSLSTGAETPVAGFATSSLDTGYTSATAGNSTVWQMTQKGHGVMDLGSVAGTNLALGQAVMASSLPVTIASNQSNLAENVAQINGASVSTAASGVQKVGVVGNTGNTLDASSSQNQVSPGGQLLVGGQFNSSITTIGNGNTSPLQLTSAARLIVDGSQVTQPVSGTVTANQGGSNWSVNVAQVNGNTTSTAATGVQKVGIVGNAGAIVDGATGAAPPANVLYVGGLKSGATGGLLAGVTVCDSDANININTSATTAIITGVSGRQVRICSINLVTNAAQGVAMIEGANTTTCATASGMAGGTTAATGWQFAANGGLTQGSGIGEIMTTVTTGDTVCLVTGAATQLSGHVKYTIY